MPGIDVKDPRDPCRALYKIHHEVVDRILLGVVFHRLLGGILVPPKHSAHQAEMHRGTKGRHDHDADPALGTHRKRHAQAGKEHGETGQKCFQLRRQIGGVETGRVGGLLPPDGPKDGKVTQQFRAHAALAGNGQSHAGKARHDYQVQEHIAQRDGLSRPGPLVARYVALGLGQDLGGPPQPALVPGLVPVAGVLLEAGRVLADLLQFLGKLDQRQIELAFAGFFCLDQLLVVRDVLRRSRAVLVRHGYPFFVVCSFVAFEDILFVVFLVFLCALVTR
mmetsp:Transcript_22881/g.48673  ORF Transcript_22881/g.48673 Transcript_22881/m.48673 type:complete len:278 (+) Transcript_22881:1260-2093(+)